MIAEITKARSEQGVLREHFEPARSRELRAPRRGAFVLPIAVLPGQSAICVGRGARAL